MLLFIIKYWKIGAALLLAIAIIGVIVHYRHTMAENDRLKIEAQALQDEVEEAQEAARNAQKARQVKEKNNAPKAPADVIAGLSDNGWLRND